MQKVKETPCAGQKKSGRPRRLSSEQQWLLLSATLLLVVLMLSGCAVSSISSRAVAVQPLSSAIVEPADASNYYQKLTNWRERVREYLETEMPDLSP